MKSILEAAPTEIAALKKRTIRSLAAGSINQQQCTYITKRLDEVANFVEDINKEGDQ